jgi:hypothetical protein
MESPSVIILITDWPDNEEVMSKSINNTERRQAFEMYFILTSGKLNLRVLLRNVVNIGNQVPDNLYPEPGETGS